MNFRKIKIEEFDKLKRLFPGDDDLWKKYKKQRLEEFKKNQIDVFIIENENEFVGELTINYVNHDLLTETIPNQRVYFEAFRVGKEFQGKGLGQELIDYCINTLANGGYTEFTIGVEEDNERAKHIYFKYGFTEAIDKGQGDEFDPSEYTLYLKRLDNMEKILYKSIENYGESKNAQLMIISRLENIADFLKHNYNVVIEERFNYNPHDD